MTEEVKNPNEAEFKFKIIAGSLFVLSWLVLIGIKLSSDISLKIPLIFSGILTIIFIISLFGKRIYNLTQKLKEKEDELKPLNEGELDQILKKEVKKMWNYIEKGTPTKRKLHNINNSIIYENHIKLYREIEFGKEKTDEIIILINTTFPNLQPAILPSNCEISELEDAINKISRNPYNPDVEETEVTTDQFGKPFQKTRRVSYSKPKEEKEGAVV